MDRSIYGTAASPSRGGYTENSTKTPDFNKLRKARQRLPVKYYKWTRFDYKHPYITDAWGSYVNENSGRGLWSMINCIENGYLSTVAGGFRVNVQSQSDAVSIVSNRLLSKIRNRPIDLGVALGEYRQTAEFVSSVISKVVKSGRALKKGNISKALRVLTGRKNDSWKDIPNVASDMWLAYSYALRPLLNDVYGAVTALANSKKPYIVVERVRTGMVFPVKGFVQNGDKSFTSSVDGSLSVSGQIEYTVENPLIRSLDMLGVLNPVSVAWELVTLSFVADWFLPIGKYLSEIVPPQGVKFQDGWISVKAKGGVSHRTDLNFRGWHTKLTSQEVVKERIVLKSFPRYYVVVPDVSLSKEKIASGLALLWTFSGQGKPSGLRI